MTQAGRVIVGELIDEVVFHRTDLFDSFGLIEGSTNALNI